MGRSHFLFRQALFEMDCPATPTSDRWVFTLNNLDLTLTSCNVLAMGGHLSMRWTLLAYSGQTVVDFAATNDLSIERDWG